MLSNSEGESFLLFKGAAYLIPVGDCNKVLQEGNNSVQEPSLGSLTVVLQPCKLIYKQTDKIMRSCKLDKDLFNVVRILLIF